jgi:hypothetical protein
MTDATTIKLSRETKQLLDETQIANETYDDTVRRLLGDTKGKAWTEQEIRSLAQDEIEKVTR